MSETLHSKLSTLNFKLSTNLWFSEVADDGADLEGGEEFLGLAVAGAEEGFGEVGVVADPLHESVDGSLGGEVGGVGHGEL